MKKIFAVVLSCCIALSITSAIVFATDDDIKIIVNGDKIDFSGDQSPVIQNGSTLVPFRLVFEKMGATVDWFPDTRLCQAYYGNMMIGIEIGSSMAQLNDVDANVTVIGGDVPAQIINGRTMVPLRILAEGIGANVSWDNDTRTINIITPDISNKDVLDSVEYTMANGGGANEEGLIINYEYPVITTEYAAAEALSELINDDIFNVVSTMLDKHYENITELNLTCNINRNESGILSLHYLDDNGNIVHSHDYSIADGISLREENFTHTSNIPNVANEFYSIVEYRVSKEAADGKSYIESTLEYPQFTESNENISSLNTQLENLIRKKADSFVASYEWEALKYFNKNVDSLFGVPYCFDSMVNVEISEEKIATITFNYIESIPDLKISEESEESVVVDLNIGEIITE